MFNSAEGIGNFDDGSGKTVSYVSHGTQYNSTEDLLRAINNELAISNMISAISNDSIRNQLVKDGKYLDIVIEISTYIEENAKNLSTRNSRVSKIEKGETIGEIEDATYSNNPYNK